MYEYNMTTFSSLVWLPKAKKEVKIKSKNRRERKSCSAIEIDRKTVFELYANPRNSHFEPKKLKTGTK